METYQKNFLFFVTLSHAAQTQTGQTGFTFTISFPTAFTWLLPLVETAYPIVNMFQVINKKPEELSKIFLNSIKIKIVWKKITFFKRRVSIILWSFSSQLISTKISDTCTNHNNCLEHMLIP